MSICFSCTLLLRCSPLGIAAEEYRRSTNMTIHEKDTPSKAEKSFVEVGTYQESLYKSVQSPNGDGPLFVVRKPPAVQRGWWRGIVSPIGVLFIAVVLMVALFSFGLGASLTSNPNSVNSSQSSS